MHHDQGDACGSGVRTLANIEGHADVRQILRNCCYVLQELQQGVRCQQEVATICLYNGRHRVAGIPFGSAGKAPQEGL